MKLFQSVKRVKSLAFGVTLLLAFATTANARSGDADEDGVRDQQDKCAFTDRGAKVNPKGCEIIDEITLHLNFESNSSVVHEDDIEELGAIGSRLESLHNIVITVEGHTDWKGKQKDNKPLSQARARAVAAVLQQESGKDKSRFRTVGYGEVRPIADNLKEEGRRKNRRVVVIIERAPDESA